MKKLKPEQQIQAVLAKYAQQRQYPDPESTKRQQSRQTQSAYDLAATGLQENALSTPNSLSLHGGGTSGSDGTVTGMDAAGAEQQFTRFRSWVASEALDEFRPQLAMLLFPLFTHLYLELVVNGHKAMAVKLHKRHSPLFQSSGSADRDICDALISVSSQQELEANHKLRIFWKSLFEVKMTEPGFQYLMRYILEDKGLILLQVINTHLLVNVSSVTNETPMTFQEEKEEWGGLLGACLDQKVGMAGEVRVKQEEVSSEERTEEGELQKQVEDCIKAVRQGPTPLPAVCLYTLHNNQEGVCSAAVDRQQQVLAAGTEASVVKLWSLVPGKLVPSKEPDAPQIHRVLLACDIDTPETPDPSEMQELKGHSDAVQAVSFMPAQSVLMTGSRDATLRAWNLSTFECLAIYRGHRYPIWSLDVSSAGFYIATGSMDRTARLWMLDRTYPLRIFAGHKMDVDSVQFHPNGQYLATGSVDRDIRLWSVTDGNTVRLFTGQKGAVFALAFSPDGKFLASAGEDRRVRVWDLNMGSCVKEMRGHTDIVYDVTWSNDGSILVSCGMDGGIRFWDVLHGSSKPGKMNDVHPSPELLGTVSTNTSCLLHLDYSQYHSVLCAGTGL